MLGERAEMRLMGDRERMVFALRSDLPESFTLLPSSSASSTRSIDQAVG